MSLLERLKRGKTRTVTIPDSDEKVQIRSLSVRELDAYAKAVQKPDADQVTLLIELLILAVQNDAGGPQWTEADKDALRDLPLAVVKHIAEEVAKFAGVDQSKNA